MTGLKSASSYLYLHNKQDVSTPWLPCLLQLPFVITKTGPVQPVLAGQAFNYAVTVVFLDTAVGVKIADLLPEAVAPSASPAAWTSNKNATSTRGWC